MWVRKCNYTKVPEMLGKQISEHDYDWDDMFVTLPVKNIEFEKNIPIKQPIKSITTNNTGETDQSKAKTSSLQTDEGRLDNYNRVRERIFKDFEVSNKMKTHQRYNKRKSEYMEVIINGIHFRGLMDSGASISCLGKNCLNNAKKMNCDIMDFSSSIKTQVI